MGAGIAARLVSRGATVLTSLAGRSAASTARASKAGVEPVDDDAQIVARADVLLSVVPPAAARATAERFRELIAGASRHTVLVDCNAIASQTVKEIAQPFIEAGLPFVDAAIIGAPPKPDTPGPRVYVSGQDHGVTELLRNFGLDARQLGAELGDASALKMSYAGITKGFQALGTAMALGAARNGALDSLMKELQDSQPQLYAWLGRQLPGMYAKAYRWDGEMREIARFLEPEAGSARMLAGAAELYEHVAEDNREGPASEIISTLNRFVNHTH